TSKVEVDPLGTQVSDSASYNYSGATGYVSSPAGFYGSGNQAHDCAVPGLGVAVPCGLTGRRSLGWGIGILQIDRRVNQLTQERHTRIQIQQNPVLAFPEGDIPPYGERLGGQLKILSSFEPIEKEAWATSNYFVGALNWRLQPQNTLL